MKKIVIIGPAHPLRGGLASYNERLAKEFISQGFDTEIHTFYYQYPKFLFPGTTQYSAEPPPQNLTIKADINSVNPLNWISVGNKIKNLRPDYVIVRYWLPFMGPCLGTILRRIKKNRHTQVICIADNIIPHEKRPGDALFTRYFVKPVDRFITMSKKVLEDLKVFARNTPSRLVPHPLYDNFGDKIAKEDARAHLKISTGDHLMLFFGFIRKYKGLDILLNAIRILNLEYGIKNIRLLIAGEFYEDAKTYEALLNDPAIHPFLILHTRFISDSEVKYYLCAADCVVQPYRSATQSGVTPLAYHFEVPMIVTEVGGLPDLVPDGKAGLVAKPDAQSIAEKIIEYFSLGERHFTPFLKEEKKKYSWKAMAEAILDN